MQVAIGVYAFLQVKDSDQFKEQLARALEVTFKDYGKSSEATEATDATQRWVNIALILKKSYLKYCFIVEMLRCPIIV